MILKKDSGDEHKFCTTLMEKTVGGIGILNSDLFSDQFFLQCRTEQENLQYMFLQSDSIMNGVGSLFLNHHLF
jgi:hypothetical protein